MIASSPSATRPTTAQILKTWLKYEGELAAVVAEHDLEPEELVAFEKDPAVRETLDAYESLVARRHRIVTMHHQTGAAEMLSKSTLEAPNSAERRRAATALARLTHTMHTTSKPTSRPAHRLAPQSPQHEAAQHEVALNPRPTLHPISEGYTPLASPTQEIPECHAPLSP